MATWCWKKICSKELTLMVMLGFSNEVQGFGGEM